MSSKSKIKGSRVEREVVAEFEKSGIRAERMPLSGAAGGSFSGDVVMWPPGYQMPWKIEVKARKSGEGFKTLERWMGENDLLVLKRDRGPMFACIRLPQLIALMNGYIKEGDDADTSA